jgi:alkanesulfonate monooxygenase SsuD/methylene tetrahydromethanopterin reductase-like flavin-dependent oxidoreductase (luciferase family)
MNREITAFEPRESRIKIGFNVAESTDDEIRQLDRMGAHSLWGAGHLWMDGPCPEAITSLARIGFLTETAEIGTSILLLPIYPPAIVAKMMIELDRMIGGRISLGIGAGGEYEPEFLAVGVPSSERGARTDEAIEVMRQLWSGEPVTFETEHGLVFENFELSPPPSRPGGIPIVVGGRAAPAMRRAARAEGWQPFMYTTKRYAYSVEAIRSEAAALGRDLDGFDWQFAMIVAVADDPIRARQRALELLHERAHPIDPTAFERISTFGTLDDVVEEMAAFVDAGVRHFITTSMFVPDLIGHAETMLGEVLPRLERHLAASAAPAAASR